MWRKYLQKKAFFLEFLNDHGMKQESQETRQLEACVGQRSDCMIKVRKNNDE